MQIDLIDNSGPRNLAQELEDQMLKATNFSIATAFITKEALEVLDIFLTKNKNKFRTGKLITGFYHCFNSKEVLQALKQLNKKTSGKLEIKISKELGFHWKSYTFEHRYNMEAYIGSANFTSSGLLEPGELIAKLTFGKKDKKEKEDLNSVFDKAWKNSVSIADIDLKNYKQTKPQYPEGGGLPAEIKKVLTRTPSGSSVERSKLPVRAVGIFGTLGLKTLKLIKQHRSNWDKNKWDYFSCYTKAAYDACIKAKTLLLIDKVNGVYKFGLSDIVDYHPIRTPDGNYFIANVVRGRWKMENESIREVLESVGIRYRSRNPRDKNLRSIQAEKVAAIFIQRAKTK